MKIELEGVPEREWFPGFKGRMIHSASMTLAYWRIDAGASLPEHHHLHEQVVNVLDGDFELTIDGRPLLLSAGDVLVIPSDVPHSGRAVSACRILDVFSPARDDYRSV